MLCRTVKTMKLRLNFNTRRSEAPDATTTTSSSTPVEWEMRPGGMLVQKRIGNSDDVPVPNLRIRVAYGAVRHQISANSQSTFGELKKLVAAETGLEAAEQRLIFKGKERENGEYLDWCGVKDGSKVMLLEDPERREKRMMEMRRNAKIQEIQRLIVGVTVEVDRLAAQVGAIEKSIGNGNKVAELQITTLIEMLMRQAIKLDNIPAEGDACANKDIQEWEDITEEEEEEESTVFSIMPCLKELELHYCPALTALPHRLLRKASSLEILEIDDCSALDDSNANLESLNNPHLSISIY